MATFLFKIAPTVHERNLKYLMLPMLFSLYYFLLKLFVTIASSLFYFSQATSNLKVVRCRRLLLLVFVTIVFEDYFKYASDYKYCSMEQIIGSFVTLFHFGFVSYLQFDSIIAFSMALKNPSRKLQNLIRLASFGAYLFMHFDISSINFPVDGDTSSKCEVILPRCSAGVTFSPGYSPSKKILVGRSAPFDRQFQMLRYVPAFIIWCALLDC
jgi:hypothetical protein